MPRSTGSLPTTLEQLRRQAVSQSLFAPGQLRTALRRLGFVQADPIRSPARAQDLILRHRVKGYRAGDLERRYPDLEVEEDMLYAYGFVAKDLWRWLHVANRSKMPAIERRVLATVEDLGETHPRQLDEHFGRKRVVGPWGGHSRQTKLVLERLHRRGLLRIARRDKGIRIYAPAPPAESIDVETRFREVVLRTVELLAPALESTLPATVGPVRRRRGIDARRARVVIDDLVATEALLRAVVDGRTYLMPANRAEREPSRMVRLLAPFDPVVWDRARFEHLWGWPYRFEAYTPAAKRVRGYYAMPILWGDDVIGWANVSTGDQFDVELGYAKGKTRSKGFARELDAEIERMRMFLSPRRR